MTMPVEVPLDVAPAEPTPAPQPQAGEPAQQQRTEPAQQQAEDISSLPEWAQKQIRDARAEAAKSRTTAKQTAAEEARQEYADRLARALGLTEDEPVDPDELTQQIEHAQAAAWRSGVELQVYRAAGTFGANADALLDSLSFIDSLDDLVDVDPRSPEFATQLEAKVQAALERNPNFRAASQAQAASATQQPSPNTPRPDPSQGARGPGAATRPTSLFDAISQHLNERR